MSASLLAMAPFVLLAIVSALCFVGCAPGGGTTFEFNALSKYSDDTVRLGESDRLLAFWRLNDVRDPYVMDQIAVNSKNNAANGTYKSETFSEDPMYHSAEAAGILKLEQDGILQGDLQSPFTDGSPRQTCIFVNGGYVSVAWHASIAPSAAEGFTIEAWVQVDWTNMESEPKADRAVVVSLEVNGAGFNGFGIRAAMDNTWQAFIGTGTGIEFVSGGPIDFNTNNHHLVATYANGELKLYVNGVEGPAPALATYVPTSAARLFIGAGGTQLAEPKIPFVGYMQCVALYRGAFSPDDVAKHLNKGNDNTP